MEYKPYIKNKLLSDILLIRKDIQQNIEEITRIKDLVLDENEIVSYEGAYCKNCKEPCGRSNAEIYNCMMEKINKKNEKQLEPNTQYTKENLEQDLKSLITDLQEKEKVVKRIMEKIQKDITHSE